MNQNTTQSPVVNQKTVSCAYSFIINQFQVDIFLLVSCNQLQVFIDGELCADSFLNLNNVNLSVGTFLSIAQYHLSQYPANLMRKTTTHVNSQKVTYGK